MVLYKYGQDLQVTKKSLKLKLDMVMHRQTSLAQQLAVKQLQVIYNTIRKADRYGTNANKSILRICKTNNKYG